ncbi:leucine-rich repeat-containing protein 45-like [Belonocnema kinseyi]|uniref:leucine-rich repeat-containing protein 45-like n=1 Tax=Belonocnema kinseyi TaxID=2817044 RepID=UPI00143D1E93|nr:leucine-rich repeat-containing protein 45-like [Belonocnema kinseyi]
MLNDHDIFEQMCEKRGVLAPPEVSEAIRVGSSTGELRLSCLSIIVPVCEILAQMLASSSSIKVLDLSDCMLLPKGLSSFLNALCDGSSISYLNLKGNSISGSTVEQLGQVFLHNNTLKILHLEWNSLGSNVECFSAFCEGLSKNHNLEELDLKYNQISPHCAEALSKVLKYNKSLKNLDLAWNTLGLQGGQMMLNGMRENKTIISLNLRGNCLPEEFMESIEQSTYENKRRKLMSETNVSKGIEVAKSYASKENEPINVSEKENRAKIKFLKKKMKRKDRKALHAAEDNQIRNSSTDTDSDFALSKNLTDSRMSESPKDALPDDQNSKMAEVNFKSKELNQILQERTSAIDHLMNEISSKQAEIEEAKSQINHLEEEVSKLKEEKENFNLEKVKEIGELQKAHLEDKESWERAKQDLEDSCNKALTLKKEVESKARRYERDIHKSSVEILALKEQLMASTQAYEDLISRGKTEMHRLRRELKERESRHKIELNILKTSLKETTQALEECQVQLQKCRNELREAAESQSSLKTKLNELEHLALRCTRSEDSLQKIKEEKEILEEKYSDAQRTIGTLQRQVANLQGELVEPQRRYGILKEELDQEREKSDRFKQELSEDRSRLKEQNIQLQKMTLQITALNTQINEIQTSHAETLRERDKERKQLKEMIAHKERDLNDLKAEEVQRAGQLYAAFSKYMSSIGPAST